MSAELDARLASAFGVELDTSAWMPGDDAEPEALLRAAEQIGAAIARARSGAAPDPSALVGDARAQAAARGEVERGPSAAARVDVAASDTHREPGWSPLPVRAVAVPSPAERRAAIDRVLAWAKASGASWNGIAIVVGESGNASVRASRALAIGEAIVTVPRRLMIVDDALGPATRGLAPRDALAAWLPIALRDPASPWREFLEAQPVLLDDLPMFHANLDALAGTNAYRMAAADNLFVRTAYDDLPAELRAQLSLADFAWGCAIVQSRGFHAPGTTEHHIALIPIVDMFDHRLGDTTWTFDPADGFVLTTERAFAAGEAVHFTYGDHGNSQLLVHYGFVEPENTAGYAALAFDPIVDPVTAIAFHLLWSLPLGAPPSLRVGTALDHRFLRALSFARLQAAGPGERARLLETGFAAYGDVPFIELAHETAAIAVLARAAARARAALERGRPVGSRGTPALSEAERVPTDDPWVQTCALVRDGERAVLDQIVAACAAIAEALRGDPAAIRATAEANSDDITAPQSLVASYLRLVADSLA